MTDIIFQRHDGAQTLAMLEEITDLYEELRVECPDDESYDLFRRPAFISRTTKQAQKSGFELITASLDHALIGFTFGYPFTVGQWWAECTPPPDEILNSSKFGVIELNVREANQKQGIGNRLLGELLGGRTEEFATLATMAGSAANAMYVRWGWRKVGYFVTPPPMDALVVPLPLAA